MTNLGQYVHLKYENYENDKTGVPITKAKNLYYALNSQHYYIEEKIAELNKADDSIYKELENRIKSAPLGKLKGKKKNLKLTPLADIIYDKLIKEYDEHKNQVANYVLSKFEDGYSFYGGKAREAVKNNNYNKTDKISDELAREIKYLIADIKQTQSNPTSRKSTIQSIFRRYDWIMRQLDMSKMNSLFMPELTPEDIEHLGFHLNDKGFYTRNEGVLNKMLEVLQLYNVADICKQIQGSYGELFILACSDRVAKEVNKHYNNITKKTYEAVQRAFEKELKAGNWTGKNTSSFNLEDKNKGNITNKVFKDLKAELGASAYNKMMINSTQDKTDVKLIIEDVPLNVSVKTYEGAQHAQLNLQSNINLLHTLASTQENFGNHWLNLHVEDAKNKNNKGRQDSDEVLLHTLKYEAFAHGNLLKNSQDADTFAVLDPFNGYAKVLSIKDILSNTQYDKNFTIKPNFVASPFYFNNNWNPNGASSRIANILSQLISSKHRINISFNLKNL